MFLVTCARLATRNQKSHESNLVYNDCHCCAERRLIRQLLHVCRKKGFRTSDFSSWLHRKYGVLVVWRPRKDGVIGVSIPCVLCRKEIERFGIQWMAFTGEKWVHSRDQDVPKSSPTHKQRRWLNFT